MGKINVVLMNLTIYRTVSGVNRYLENLCRALTSFQDIVVHQVTLLQKPDMFFHQITKNNGVVEATIMLPHDMEPVVSGLYWMEKYAGVVAKLLTPYFAGMENLIWHTHCINLSQLAELLKQEIGGVYLTHLHCIPWKFAVENNVPRFKAMYRKYESRQFDDFNDSPVEKYTYRVADHIICVTHSAEKYLTEAMHVLPDKITTVYNGLEVLPAGWVQRREEKDVHILYVGRISREKGVPYLLQALLQVYKRGFSVRITLAGKGNAAYIKHLSDEYACLKPDFRGHLKKEELEKLYQSCTMGIIPSLHEQCSYVAMEMGMYGIPLIVSDVDGLGEIFEDGRNALKVPLVFDEKEGVRVNVDQLADCVIRLIENKTLRMALGRKAEKVFRRQFGLERMAAETVAVYRSFFTAEQMAPEEALQEVTVVWHFRNAGKDISKAILQLFRHCGRNCRVIAVNDASDDGCDYRGLLKNMNQLLYVENKTQMGLAGSWDKAVALAETEYVLLLDQYIRIEHDILTRLLDHCRESARALFSLQTRMWTPGQGGKYYKLQSIPGIGGGVIDFFGICGPLEVCRNRLMPADRQEEVLVPCVRGSAYAIRKDYYMYLHGLNGLTEGAFKDAFLSTKVWREGGKCVLLLEVQVGRIYVPGHEKAEDSVLLAYEKIMYARLLMETWAVRAEEAVRIHLAARSRRIIDEVLTDIVVQTEEEQRYLSGIFTRTMEDIFNLNAIYGNRIYPLPDFGIKV